MITFFASYVVVEAGEDLIEEFDAGDLRADAAPDASELEPDHATADDDEVLRDLVQLQRAGRGDDDLLVDLDAGKRGDRRPGGDDDVLGADGAVANFDRVGALKAGAALQPFDLVLLKQELDAAGEALHGVDALGVHGREIEFRRNLDAHLGHRSAGRRFEIFGCVEEGLRGDAADVETGAAERLAAFRAGGLQA